MFVMAVIAQNSSAPDQGAMMLGFLALLGSVPIAIGLILCGVVCLVSGKARQRQR
jgi:hypothetical protein